MNRTEKADEVALLKSQIDKAKITILSDYKGMTVSAVTDLRRKLYGKQSSFKVVKNRLAKIAVKGLASEGLAEHFKGTTAITTTEVDISAASKILTEFAKANEKLQIKIGYIDGKILSLKEIESLANLPSKEELISKLMASMQAPMSNLVSVMAQIPRQIVNVLSAIKDQKEKNV